MSELNQEGPHQDRLVEKMRDEWDQRARENARHFVATEKTDWTDEEFFASGEEAVANHIRTDMINICQGKDPKRMKVLEIGCGAGRVTRALANLFGTVYAVDISGEMVARAREALAGVDNVVIEQNNGRDLSVLGDIKVDFAFSYIVFQHVPSKAVIESYVREVYRVLRFGGLFKFQVQGDFPKFQLEPDWTLDEVDADSWIGVPFTDNDAVDLALRCGFEPRHRHGAGQQEFWLWYFRRWEWATHAVHFLRRCSQYLRIRWETWRRSS